METTSTGTARRRTACPASHVSRRTVRTSPRSTSASPIACCSGSGQGIDFIAEAFNLFNRDNEDVTSIVSNEFLSGPTLANPGAALVPNPRYRQYLATLPPFEMQIGVRFAF